MRNAINLLLRKSFADLFECTLFVSLFSFVP